MSPKSLDLPEDAVRKQAEFRDVGLEICDRSLPSRDVNAARGEVQALAAAGWLDRRHWMIRA